MQTKLVEYFDGEDCLEGYLAYDETQTTPRPGVLVVHDWSGRNEHAQERAEKLAVMGYVGFAVDMYGKGLLGKNNDEKTKFSTPFFENRDLVKQRMELALNTLQGQEPVDSSQIAALGFCFGGMCALDLARANNDLKAAISFHGILTAPESACVTPMQTKVLVLHGHDDPMVNSEAVLAFEEEMSQAKADWQVHVYGKTLHAFTNKLANDPGFGTVYDELADKRSWQSCTAFLKEVFE